MGGDHKCQVCQATFTRPQHVARHMRSHTGDRPYKCPQCGDQFARSDLLSRHVNKCHPDHKEKDGGGGGGGPQATTATAGRRKGVSASRATTSKQACDQCVQNSLPCDGCNPCAKCVQRKCRCTFVKFHRQTAPSGPGHSHPHTGGAYGVKSDPLGLGIGGMSAAALGCRSVWDMMLWEVSSSGTASISSSLSSTSSMPPEYNFNPVFDLDIGGVVCLLPSRVPFCSNSKYGSTTQNEDFAAKYRAQAELLRQMGNTNQGTSSSYTNGSQISSGGAGNWWPTASSTSFPGTTAPPLGGTPASLPSARFALLDELPRGRFEATVGNSTQQRRASIPSEYPARHDPTIAERRAMHGQHGSPPFAQQGSAPFPQQGSPYQDTHQSQQSSPYQAGGAQHGSPYQQQGEWGADLRQKQAVDVRQQQAADLRQHQSMDSLRQQQLVDQHLVDTRQQQMVEARWRRCARSLVSTGGTPMGWACIGGGVCFAAGLCAALAALVHLERGSAQNHHSVPGVNSGRHPSFSSSDGRPYSSSGVSDQQEGGFSSAFGLMSLDDPAVLAGLANDGTQFFSTEPAAVNGRPRNVGFMSVDDLTPMPRTGGLGWGVRASWVARLGEPFREAETRELKEFWKHSCDVPTGYRRARVSSLPSVKTPTAEGAGGVGNDAKQRTLHGAAEDLRSYEAAVLARKAPVNLNLVPRMRRGTNSGKDKPSPNDMQGTGSPANQSPYSSASPSPHPGYVSFAPPQSGAQSFSSQGGGDSMLRPSFKRLASSTLGPELVKKRNTVEGEGDDLLRVCIFRLALSFSLADSMSRNYRPLARRRIRASSRVPAPGSAPFAAAHTSMMQV
ncbi:hypothetical protein BD626DRAFT_507831 [Schizophyllum amplum]|uniref:C2H2-type domain-containing protein n=1 Tax=Schizophyllum amplum TaxID=97359 RepID=A0A550C4E9_9AGAR|nr:hypothetical protein BD626DRAFT_507831 [Auriculariopsis ampla]